MCCVMCRVMCCVALFFDVLRCSDTSIGVVGFMTRMDTNIGVVGFVTRSRIREEL
jgi:hypothetical protein